MFVPVTTSGRVVTGQGSCVQLVTTTVRWVLVGGREELLVDGADVRVTGLPSPGTMAGCDGQLLAVRSIRPV